MSFSSFINFNHIANSNCVSNSLKEPKAIYKNRWIAGARDDTDGRPFAGPPSCAPAQGAGLDRRALDQRGPAGLPHCRHRRTAAEVGPG